MSTIDEALQTQIRNIEEKYGKSPAEWIALIRESGITKHIEIIAMLKSQYGVTHGSANRLALIAREADAASIIRAAKATGSDPIDDIYSGKKAGLKPLHDTLITTITTFGNDIEVALKKGYVSVRRKKQFAMLQPTTVSRIDVGLILKDAPTIGRLESASGLNAMFTHRIRVSNIKDIDEQLITWLKQAYDFAG